MDKKRFIPLTLFALAVLGLVAWGYPILKGRYADTDEEEAVIAPSRDSSLEEFPQMENSDAEIDTDEELGAEENSEEEEAAKLEDEFLQITPSDCDNKCKGFEETEDEEYCRQRCGLAEKAAPASDDNACARLEDLQRDYCLKDLAVNKDDPKMCADIEDGGIRKTCQNRFIEDMLDSSTAGGADF